MGKRTVFYAITLVLLITFIPSTTYAFALYIAPSSFKKSAKPGDTITGSVTVYNKADYAMGIRAYEQDWIYDEDGTKKFLPPGTTSLSCAEWINIFPRKFTVAAQSEKSVQFTITLPEDAEGGYYAVIFFESIDMSEGEGERDITVGFAARLGTIVYLETEGSSVKEGEIEGISIRPPSANTPFLLKFTFKNKGNTFLKAEGMLNIMDDDGNLYGRQKFGPIMTLPGDENESKVEWFGDLEKGEYNAVITLDLGTDMPIVEEEKFQVK